VARQLTAKSQPGGELAGDRPRLRTSRIDQRALRVAADAYRDARRGYAAAGAAAETAHERLQTSPDTVEYQSDWIAARREEAAAASRLQDAEEAYRGAGGYVGDKDD
jgi:hypothetical protein